MLDENTKLALRLVVDFKNTQPKKKRQNIDRAFRKLSKGEPLNRLEKEALSELHKFLYTYKEQ